ncbi:flagellar M-ring protein FliF, partial [bacterium]|nr:flagellar M-ring protein FliF [bacterium]
FIRGLQDELETGLIRLEPIENAKVYIVKPKKEVFKEDQKEPTASIFLKIKPGFDITKEQIRAIREWISSAVEGLKPENIRITDTMARDLSQLLADEESMTLDKMKTAQLKFRRDNEKELEHKLQSQLETVFGRAVVRVTAAMDFDQKEAISDIVVPPIEGSDKGITLSEKIEQEKYSGRDLTTEGEPGVNSNVPPGSPAYPSKEEGMKNEYEKNGAIRNYEFTRSKEKFIKEQGVLRNISVSVILDKDPRQLGGDIEEQIRSIAQATVGFNKKRGDVLTLMIIPFNNDLAERARREMDERQRQERTMFLIVIGLLMSIPVFIGMIYIFVRLSRGRVLAQEKSALEAAAQEAAALQATEDAKKAQLEAQRLKEQAKRFEDIKNFYPEIDDVEEKKRKIQELRYKAYLFAKDNDKLPQDFDEMIPEEQYIFQEAFKRKSEGSLEEGLARLANIINEREKIRQEHLNRLQAEAKAKMNLEERVRTLVTGNPDDAVQVLRSWLEE